MNRLSNIVTQICGSGVAAPSDDRDASAYRRELQGARAAIIAMINEKACHPIMIRLAWHDSGTFDKNQLSWPRCGGANGSIRFNQELGHGANAGLKKAVAFIAPIKKQFPLVSYADLYQMASAEAVRLASGGAVVIPMKYGRVDTAVESECPPEGNLPAAAGPFPDGAPNAATHLRNVFYRMGFGDKDIVALSGAHTLGRAFKDRSGTVEEAAGSSGTKFTDGKHDAHGKGSSAPNVGMKGGRSWTKYWLKFDNEYFQNAQKPNGDGIVVLETDHSLFLDPMFQPHARRYAQDPDCFFREYAEAHKRLSELGSKFAPAHGILIE